MSGCVLTPREMCLSLSWLFFSFLWGLLPPPITPSDHHAYDCSPLPSAPRVPDRTFLERAVVQHNMVAAAHVYRNISFEELAVLLEVSPEQV